MSLYDKEAEQMRLEEELEYWIAQRNEATIDNPLLITLCDTKLDSLNAQLKRRKRCECGAHAAGFSSHTHYCPITTK
jgi:hypothetical protein